MNPIRYRGYYFDAETGFYYLQSRYYDPVIGRFLNADGLTQTGQGVLDQNMFAYCLNNPVMMADPDGECPCPWKAWCDCPPEVLKRDIIANDAYYKLYTYTFTYITYETRGKRREKKKTITYTIAQHVANISNMNNPNLDYIMKKVEGTSDEYEYYHEVMNEFAWDIKVNYQKTYNMEMPFRSIGGISYELGAHYVGYYSFFGQNFSGFRAKMEGSQIDSYYHIGGKHDWRIFEFNFMGVN